MQWATTRRLWSLSVRPTFVPFAQSWLQRDPRSLSLVGRSSRAFSLDTLTAVLIPPTVFGGLVITLWTYKCFMMVLFQNKIIYMPSVPPFSRSEKVSDYAAQCRPVIWREHTIGTVDGVAIKLLEGSLPESNAFAKDNHVVAVYFQGNASSLPPRLPFLSGTLKLLASGSPEANDPCFSIVSVSYRGFWTSKGRPSERGIKLDSQAVLQWILRRYDLSRTKIVIWGQSIGAGVATTALADLLEKETDSEGLAAISGLVLETPFVDLRSMLVALYPHKFLPYRYLYPFLRSTWDSHGALKRIGATKSTRMPNVLILQAGSDEIVPAGQAEILQRVCKEIGMDVELRVIKGALHTEIMAKQEGRKLVAQFLQNISRQGT